MYCLFCEHLVTVAKLIKFIFNLHFKNNENDYNNRNIWKEILVPMIYIINIGSNRVQIFFINNLLYIAPKLASK